MNYIKNLYKEERLKRCFELENKELLDDFYDFFVFLIL